MRPIKKRSFNLLCVLDFFFFFQNAGSQICIRFFFFFLKTTVRSRLLLPSEEDVINESEKHEIHVPTPRFAVSNTVLFVVLN